MPSHLFTILAYAFIVLRLGSCCTFNTVVLKLCKQCCDPVQAAAVRLARAGCSRACAGGLVYKDGKSFSSLREGEGPQTLHTVPSMATVFCHLPPDKTLQDIVLVHVRTSGLELELRTRVYSFGFGEAN
eukprot:4120903-Amphidinium_carterae.1